MEPERAVVGLRVDAQLPQPLHRRLARVRARVRVRGRDRGRVRARVWVRGLGEVVWLRVRLRTRGGVRGLGGRRGARLGRVHEHLQPQVLDEGVAVLWRELDREVEEIVSRLISAHA